MKCRDVKVGTVARDEVRAVDAGVESSIRQELRNGAGNLVVTPITGAGTLEGSTAVKSMIAIRVHSMAASNAACTIFKKDNS